MSDFPAPSGLSPELAEAQTRRGNPDYPGLFASFVLLGVSLLAIGLVAFLLAALELGLDFDTAAFEKAAGPNVVAIGLVLLWGCGRTGLPMTSVLRLGAFPPLLLVPFLVFVLGASILLSEVDNLLRSVLPVPEMLQKMLLEMLDGSFSSFVALVIVAPLTEELLFRGLILRGLIAQRGVRSAVLYSSLLFALLHLNPWQFAPAFALGIVFGWIFVQGRSLLPCILLHATFNMLSFLGGGGYVEAWGISIPGYSQPLTNPVSFQPPAFDLLGLLLAVGSLVWIKKIFERDAKLAVSRV